MNEGSTGAAPARELAMSRSTFAARFTELVNGGRLARAFKRGAARQRAAVA